MGLIENAISEQIKKYNSAPYLFIGSGFSRRYLGLEDWQGLLQKFCKDLKPYEYYKSTHNNDLPVVAGAMSRDYNQVVWSSTEEEMTEFVKKNSPNLLNSSSALKIAISDYLTSFGAAQVDAQYKDEIEALKQVQVEGIITTNWDNLLKDLFPGFETVIGQDGLISSSTFGLGEIFKIHGCSTKPESLVLTDEDYRDFNRRNAYLAAKLVTYFVEHPVIFLGYSLTDENVTEILSSIINCMGRENIQKLDDNFIFVQRTQGEEKLTRSYKNIGGAYIPIIILELKDFGNLYRPLSQLKRKLSMRLMRYLKEQLYEFVHSNNPKGKVAVLDFGELDENVELSKIEVVIGVGLMQKLSPIGYHLLKPYDIIKEFLFEERKDLIDFKQLLESTFADLNNGYLPIHKFINSIDEIDTAVLPKVAKKNLERTRSEFSSGYKRSFEINYKHSPLEEFFGLGDINKTLNLLVLYDFKTEEDVDKLGDFLKSIFNDVYPENEANANNNTKSLYRKVISLYDFLKYKKSTRPKFIKIQEAVDNVSDKEEVAE